MLPGDFPPTSTLTKASNIAIVILAAGASTRMGTPKQLLNYRGSTLLGYAIECAIASECGPIVVVLGANADKIKPAIQGRSIHLIENPDWKEGISTSIRHAIRYLNEFFQDIEAVILSVCDQPFISCEIFNRAIEIYYSTGKEIVACKYANTIGVPALFSRAFFSELLDLKNDRGAKQTIEKYLDRVYFLPFPLGEVDLDTPEDYRNSIAIEKGNFT